MRFLPIITAISDKCTHIKVGVGPSCTLEVHHCLLHLLNRGTGVSTHTHTQAHTHTHAQVDNFNHNVYKLSPACVITTPKITYLECHARTGTKTAVSWSQLVRIQFTVSCKFIHTHSHTVK